ncbi:MAG: GTP-binding protein [Leptolyngbyaceae cyanobacterium RM1_1_2]|nr:GTP-binding protein [Leptolyngbyaceae cyanobacterium RM1_1_2]
MRYSSNSDLPNITLVSGPCGAGKTSWIRQQALAAPGIYLSLGAESAVDMAYLTAEVPDLTVLPTSVLSASVQSASNLSKLSELLEHPPAEAVYIELSPQLDLNSLPLDLVTACRRIAVLPPGLRQTRWHDWTDLVVTGAEITGAETSLLSSPPLWNRVLTGQVFDLSSLNTLWYELTQGAYGTVRRAKGIFDVADGRALYWTFVAGQPETAYLELNLPRWLQGRPERFSGLEVVGQGLDQAAVAQTLQDCCLSEQAIFYYQQQVKDLLAQGEAA